MAIYAALGVDEVWRYDECLMFLALGEAGSYGPIDQSLQFPQLTVAEANRLKALGATAKFFTMDEPLYYGHIFGKPGWKVGCHSSIPDIARDVAEKVRQIRLVFPLIRELCTSTFMRAGIR